MTTAELVPVDSGPEEIRDDTAATPVPVAVAQEPASEDADGPAVPDAQTPEWEERLQASDARLGLLEAGLVELVGLLAENGSGLEAIRAEARSAQAAADAAQVVADMAKANAEVARSAVDVALTGVATSADASAVTTRKVVAVGRQRQTDADARVTALEGRLGDLEGSIRGLDESVGRLAERAVEHDSALAEVQRTIAAEVERHTCDALVESAAKPAVGGELDRAPCAGDG